LLDPEIEVKPTRGQIDDLMEQIGHRTARGERVLVTTLTKRMAEDLADFLREANVKVHYLHSEVDTLERVEILRDLRLGVYDVVVGINLLREGLDLPEVSLVAILDADKEGFLRSETSLIQTSGRAARHINGQVILYADQMTKSMQRAIEEMSRRRDAQMGYNEEHGITPQTIVKSLDEVLRSTAVADAAQPVVPEDLLPSDALRLDRESLIELLEREMLAAAAREEFEVAASLRDRLDELRLEAGKERSDAPRIDRRASGPDRVDRGHRRGGRHHRSRR